MKTLDDFNTELREINKGSNKSSTVRNRRKALIEEALDKGFRYSEDRGFWELAPEDLQDSKPVTPADLVVRSFYAQEALRPVVLS